MLISEKIKIEKSREEQILTKVKNNLERIRQRQSQAAKMQPKEHFEAIRSGDYYMFDDLEEVQDEEDCENQKDCADGKDHVDFKIAGTKDKHETENSEEKEKPSWRLKILILVKKYFVIGIERVIELFNNYSQDFREVSKVLTKEKITLRNLENSALQPNTSANLTTSTNVDLDEVDAEYDLNGKPLMYRLFNSIYYLLLSQSELVCYFLMILTHLLSASILSLPLPFAVFLWALLSLPRPNKIFWITCITYIEVCILLSPDYSNKTFVRIF
jgi:hypothetical protein